jgi:hypothetical protein
LFLAWPGPRGKCRARLEAEGFRVYLPRKVSPGDGGLSYGQVGCGGGETSTEVSAVSGNGWRTRRMESLFPITSASHLDAIPYQACLASHP